MYSGVPLAHQRPGGSVPHCLFFGSMHPEGLRLLHTESFSVCWYVNRCWAWWSSTSGLNTVGPSLRSGCIHGAILQHTMKQFCCTLRISQMWMWENVSCVVNEEQDRATPEIKGLLCLWTDGRGRSSVLLETNDETREMLVLNTEPAEITAEEIKGGKTI